MVTLPGSSDPPEIIAHRGYGAVAPENSIAAIERAVEAGAEAIEVDLRTTIDGIPVLFHDADLDRTSNGAGPLGRRTATELKALDAGSWFSSDFAGETIPTLAEAAALLSRRACRFYPELKAYRRMEDLDGIVRIIREAGLLGRTVFLAMDGRALSRIGERTPEAGIGHVVQSEERFGEALKRAEGDPRALLDLSAELVRERPELVRIALDGGTEVGVWTVDDVDECARLVEAGVTRITTNRLERMTEWKRLRGSEGNPVEPPLPHR